MNLDDDPLGLPPLCPTSFIEGFEAGLEMALNRTPR